MRLIALALFAASGLLLLAGCQRPPTTTLKQAPPIAETPGWYAYEVPGFTFMAPDPWGVPRMEDAGPGTDPNELQNLQNPAVGYGLAPASGSSTENAALVLVDRSSRPIPGEPRTQLVVTHKKVGGGANLEAEANEVKKGQMFIKTTETLNLPIGPCVEYVVRYGTKTGDRVFERYYVLVNNEDVAVFRFTQSNSGNSIEAVARPLMETVRLKSAAPAKG